MSRINVIDASGQIQSIPRDQLKDAEEQGYRIATPSEESAHFEQEKYTSGANPALAALAGAGRALTFGASDVALSKTGLVKPETLKKLEEYNPVESIGGEAAATLGSLLVPGYGAATAEQTLARQAARAVSAPVRAATELGEKAAAKIIGTEAAATALGRVAQTGARMGVAGATEGALYGAGRVLTEYGMGDPVLNGESILSHVGLSAVLGGALGTGLGVTGKAFQETLGAVKASLPKKPLPEPEVLSVIETKKGPEAVISAPEGTLDRAMQEEGVELAKREQILEGSNRLKRNSKEIIDASTEEGLPVFESQISSDPRVQNYQSSLWKSPTVAGTKQRLRLDEGFERAAQRIDQILEVPEVRTAAEAGDLARQQILKRADELYSPIKSGYQQADQARLALLSDDVKLGAFDEFMSKAGQHRKSSDSYKLRSQYAEELMEVSDLGQLDDMISDIRNRQGMMWRAGDKKGAHVLGDVVEDLDKMRETVEGLTPEMKALRAENKKKYREFIETLGDLAGAGRLGKIRNYTELLDRLESVPAEKLAGKLFDKKNSKGLEFIRDNFPDVFKTITDLKKSEVLEIAMKDGKTDVRKVLREISDNKKLSPEIRSLIFDPAQNQSIKNIKTWVDAIPGDINPSGTAQGLAYQKYFDRLEQPTAMGMARDAINEVRDMIRAQYVEAKPEQVAAFIQMERAARKTLKKIESGAKEIFSSRPTGYAASKIAETLVSHDETDKLLRDIRNLASNPDLMIEKLSAGAELASEFAPETTQSAQASAARAIQYLSLVAPPVESAYPLGEKPVPSRRDLNIFSERLNLIKDPSSILTEIKAGTLTPEHVEAVATIYPKMFQDMQMKVIDELTKTVAKKKPINYKTKNMLSLFLNQDLDEAITSIAIVQNQAAIRRAHQDADIEAAQFGGGVKPTQTGLSKLDKSTQAMTAMQKSSQRIES